MVLVHSAAGGCSDCRLISRKPLLKRRQMPCSHSKNIVQGNNMWLIHVWCNEASDVNKYYLTDMLRVFRSASRPQTCACNEENSNNLINKSLRNFSCPTSPIGIERNDGKKLISGQHFSNIPQSSDLKCCVALFAFWACTSGDPFESSKCATAQNWAAHSSRRRNNLIRFHRTQ